GELKNTFCLTSGQKLYLSPYIGDLGDARAIEALEAARLRMQGMLSVRPEAAVCDLHPDYHSSHYARSLGLPVLGVQHHFAHIASCLAENGRPGPVIGVAFDGTGYGADGTLWGGEFLVASLRGFERPGSIEPFALFGGDAASVEFWRPAVSLLLQAGGERAAQSATELGICSAPQLAAARAAIAQGLNCVKSTSVGRLFDAAAAVLGVKARSDFEGEAAMTLEYAAREGSTGFEFEPEIVGGAPFMLNTGALIARLLEERLDGTPRAMLAYGFHEALARMVVLGCEKCRAMSGLGVVALSGGCFQNLLLLELCRSALEKSGFDLLLHSMVPANDGGIALGQAAVWMAGAGD
ncbi:MAG: carbamoyltransferase HypF, partial [Clostridia bacterium]|nr:carbamoyltransferase HypF [Clostridia bacterium]